MKHQINEHWLQKCTFKEILACEVDGKKHESKHLYMYVTVNHLERHILQSYYKVIYKHAFKQEVWEYTMIDLAMDKYNSI